MIVIYTGDGKGKTSACLGQVIRAKGHNLNVAFTHFFKEPDSSGEQAILHTLLNDNYNVGGLGFMFDNKDFDKHRAAALKIYTWAKNKLQDKIDILILDEALYALNAKILLEEEIDEIIDICKEKNIHLILSGRNLPIYLAQKADLISEILAIKHPFSQGKPATQGIDF